MDYSRPHKRSELGNDIEIKQILSLAKNNNLSALEEFLKLHSINLINIKTEETAVSIAARENDSKIVNILLSYGAKIEDAIYGAAQGNNTSLVYKLLRKSKDNIYKTEDVYEAMVGAAAGGKVWLMFQLLDLVNNQQKNNAVCFWYSVNQALYYASKNSKFILMYSLFTKFSKYISNIDNSAIINGIIMNSECQYNDISNILHVFLKITKGKIKIKDILFSASKANNIQLVDKILNMPMNSLGLSTNTMLEYAAQHNLTKTFNMLLSKFLNKKENIDIKLIYQLIQSCNQTIEKDTAFKLYNISINNDNKNPNWANFRQYLLKNYTYMQKGVSMPNRKNIFQ